jgi:hypothetical protein
MRHTDDRSHIRVEIVPRQCTIPADERTRMEGLLVPLREAVSDFPSSDLLFHINFHPQSQTYHVEARLKLPGKTLFTGDTDAYLDSAFQRCLRKLLQKVADYKERPDHRAEELAERRAALERDIVAPEGPEDGLLGRAVQAGDYRAFRNALVGFEDWLRKRVGRWVQRYPEAEARIGDGLLIGDLVEEVYLNAFERYRQRRAEVPLHEWLDGLIDPSLKAMLRHPDLEKENASFARTVRETPL